MSSDLRDLVLRDLEQIPLPPPSAWTQRRSRRSPRGIGLVASAGIVLVVIVASLSGGQLLQAARDRIEALRASNTSGLVAGNDLIYVTDGDPASQGLQVVAMPSGRAIGRFDAATYVGTRQEGGLMSISGDIAALPVARPTSVGSDQHEVHLQMIDLRRGSALARLGMGTFALPQPTDLPGTSRFAVATATSTDGQFVWVVRDTGERGQIAQVYRFDVNALPGPAAQAVLTSTGDTTVRSRVIPLGGDKLIVMREHYSSFIRVAADWYVLDAALNVLKSFAGDDTRRLPVSGLCSPDVRSDPASGRGWIILCSDPSLATDGAVIFLDGQRFDISGRVTLERSMGFAVAMRATGDGRVFVGDPQITVVTDRPVVARIDPRTRTLVDARTVTRARAWFEGLLSPVAAAKQTGGPYALISLDGRYAYVADMPDRWGALATIDLATATVVANNNQLGTVIALGLSGEGDRLYALAADSAGERSLVLLEPRTLTIAVRSDALPNAFAIVGVRSDAR